MYYTDMLASSMKWCMYIQMSYKNAEPHNLQIAELPQITSMGLPLHLYMLFSSPQREDNLSIKDKMAGP